MYAEMFAGLHGDPRELLQKTFTQKYDEMVLVKDIGFAELCEHHLLPFFGKAHVAYLPNGKIVGLSKLARVVEALAQRPQVQERMTEELADLLMEELDARGVGVILEATHTCMTIRGVRKPGSICTTSAMRGVFRDNPSTRAELMALIYGAAVMPCSPSSALRLACRPAAACSRLLAPPRRRSCQSALLPHAFPDRPGPGLRRRCRPVRDTRRPACCRLLLGCGMVLALGRLGRLGAGGRPGGRIADRADRAGVLAGGLVWLEAQADAAEASARLTRLAGDVDLGRPAGHGD